MNWSPQQVRALDAASRWLTRGTNPVFRLFGYAGTGKTSLAQELASTAKGRVLFAAFTGKAAHVMKARGCPNATTIHRLIYQCRPKSKEYLRELQEALNLADKNDTTRVSQLERLIEDELAQVSRPAFVLNPESEVHNASLVVIDECSMVDEDMGNDLLSFGKPILVLGDPAQLPPVFGAGFFTEQKPDEMLTEIHRQALDSPILKLATAVRKGEQLEYGEFVRPRSEFRKELVRDVDQVIVGRNATRTRFNQNYRRHILGFEGALPGEGDKLVCLRNNHELGLLNGAQWWVDICREDPATGKLSLTINDGEGGRMEVLAHREIDRKSVV